MPVTKQTYTLNATWTAAQLADTFRTAFIDSGLMTDWFDSFTSSAIENRIVRVVYNAAKADGFTFYWFMFTTTGVFLHTLADYDEVNNIPRGTLYLDYFSTATNVTTNHRTLYTVANATTVTITRYTSQINNNATVFLVRNGGTSRFVFHISSAGFGPQSFIDLDRYHYNGVYDIISEVTNAASSIVTRHVSPALRKTFLGSSSLRGATSASSFNLPYVQYRYQAQGNNVTAGNNTGYDASPCITLPTGFTNTNTQLTTNHIPVYTQVSLSPYIQNLPADFGLVSLYTTSTPVAGDKIIISAGTDEWEILQYSNNVTTSAAQLYFAARVTG
jgi:hypothetical protein